MVYIYNHVLDDWNPIEPESVDTAKKLVTFKTQVLGYLRVKDLKLVVLFLCLYHKGAQVVSS
jgi:hypothetical protein